VPAISSLWEKVLGELPEARGIQSKILEVDNAGYQLIAAAREFDVVVSPNMFGDILADFGSLLLGSRGMSFSGNFGPAGRAVYQTAHGAAHDLTGTDRANPVGQIFSLAMLLRESFALEGMADAIENAIEQVVRDGWRTADIATSGSRIVGTRKMGDLIVRKLEEHLLEAPRVQEPGATFSPLERS
jgi:3-isopropylmalate dehydrogenase